MADRSLAAPHPDQLELEQLVSFKTLADSVPVLIRVSGPDRRCTWVNRQWLQFVGGSLLDELGDGWITHVHPDDIDRCLTTYAKAFEAGQPFSMEYRLRRHDGSWRWILDNGSPSDKFNGYVGSCIDITEAKESNMRLDLLHRITRSIGGREDLGSIYQKVMGTISHQFGFDFGCICTYDGARHVLTIANLQVPSPAIASRLPFIVDAEIPIDGPALTGAIAGEVVYEPILTRDTPSCQALSDGGLSSLVAAPLRVDADVFGVLVVARSAADAFSPGERDFLERLSQHVGLAARQAELLTALQDAYDDLRQTQHAVLEQERLRVIGQMASGIAHDITNGISPVLLYTETILESEPGLSAESREYLRTIQRAVEDVSHTLGRLSDFSRRREPVVTLKPLDVNALVDQVRTLTRARWKDMPLLRGHVIRVQADLEAGLPPVLGVESELREALTNLVINAIDAMPTGGTVTIRTRLVADAVNSTVDSSHIELEVIDTGVGMDEETRRRCLEPFFTTKGVRGTGLGLAMVCAVVQRHNAQLEIDSSVGMGTTMRMVFAPHPVSMSLDTAQPTRAPAPVPLRVLAIDDDPLFIQSLRDVLERDGHLVTTASGGAEGIEIFHTAVQRGEAFNAVLTDLAMPHVDGYKVASAVKRAGSSTLVVMLTGWARRLSARGLPANVDHLLGKPPKLHELRAALATVTSPHQRSA